VGSRPISAGVNFALAPLSQWVGKCLKGNVLKGKRYLGSSWDLILFLRNLSFPNGLDVQLCSGDVFTMYPKVDLYEVSSMLLDKVGEILPTASSKWKKFFCKVSNWVLFKNFTQFDGLYWQQKAGLPMGSSASPELCNFYMSNVEDEISKNLSDSLHEFPIWLRYIDDIFCIHIGEKSGLDKFCSSYNSVRDKIKVNFAVSSYSVNFLDLTIMLKRHWRGDCTIEWKLFQKASYTFLYSPHTSFHKKSWKENWIVSNLITYARNSSRRKYFIKMAEKFYFCLRCRGFTPELLNNFFEFVDWGGRGMDAILSPLRFSKSLGSNGVVTPFISIYNPTFASVPFLSLLTCSVFWKEICVSPYKDILGDIIIAHRREKNITEWLTRAVFKGTFFHSCRSTQEDINLLQSLSLF